MKKIFIIITLFLAANAFPETGDGYKIRLKSRIFTPQENAAALSTHNYKGHRIVQFKQKLTEEVVMQLQQQGIRIVGHVPENALALSIPENADLSAIKNIHWIGKLEVEDKISSRISKKSDPQYVLVDVFEDVDRNEMERRIRKGGAELISNPYLANYTFLVKASERQLRTLAQDDAVNYIYPASQQIIDGKPVYQCPGASTTFGRILNFVTNGVGWDGEGQGAATVRYAFENGTPDVAGENAEVVAALETWSYYARIDWTQLQVPDQPIAIDISWRSGNHGDGNQNAFDGAGNVLAHCFFPSDINSEPIAGDLHFDEAETWVIGPDDPANGSFDLYSIALHEAGHGLGLNHSDDPNAVMFASYGGPPFADLRDDDIAGIRSLYLPFFTPRSPAPIFDPPAGTYDSPLEVRLQYGPGTSMENTQLRYTLDGSEPTPYSFQIIPELGDYIFQRFSNTIRARAFTRGSPPSEVVSATYTLIQPTPQAETPVITPNGGTFVNTVTVNIDAETPFSVIRVTTDGTEPTPQSFSYGGPFPVNETSTVKAKAFVSGMTPSETATANFNIIDQVATPNFYPQNGGVFAQPLNVVIDCETIDATIRYTEDGSEPDENSQIYTNPVFVGETKTISAKAFLTNVIPSGVRSATFVIAAQTDQPVIEPNGGTFVNSVEVTLSSTLPGATIRYTTNGSDPTSFSTEYTAPFTLNVGAHTVKARAFLEGANPGPIAEALFNVFTASINQVETPTMNPFSGQQFVTNFPVTMDCRTEDAIIRYTVGFDQLPPDPTETGAGSITYNGPFQFGAPGFTYFFKVQAYKEGMAPSDIIQSGGFAVSEPLGMVDTVAIIPHGGTFANPVQVTLESTTPFATIYFTEDGTIPNTFQPILPPTRRYNSPFNVLSARTITAIGTRTLFGDSDTTSAVFIFKCATPDIMPESGTYFDSLVVRMESETAGGNTTIRYTLDGSDPDENSEEYTEPFTLGIGDYALRAKTFRFNFLDSETADAEFVVMPEPVPVTITQQPADQSVNTGETATFEVQATGVPDPAYQWQRNGVDLPNATDSLLFLPNVQLGDSGDFRVIVSNLAGADTSQTVTLDVQGSGTAVARNDITAPTEFTIEQNYPNPFNPTTTLRFSLPVAANVNIDIYNLVGQKIRTLAAGNFSPGYHEIVWDARDDSGSITTTGVYIYRIHANEFIQSRKMVLMK